MPVAAPTLPGLPVATTTQRGDRVQSVGAPSETADWRVNTEGGDYVVDLPAAGGDVLALDVAVTTAKSRKAVRRYLKAAGLR